MTAAFFLTLVPALPALSQRGPARPPSGGLFGGTRSDVSGAGKLNFMFEFAEGVDSVSPVDVSVSGAPGLRTDGFSTLFGASSEYVRGGQRLEVAASASTAFKYYERLDRLDALSHSAGLGASLRLPKQGSLRVEQAAAYSPSYLYQLFPMPSPALGASIPPNPDYQIAQTESYSYITKLALVFGSARGTQLTTSGEYSHTDFEHQSAVRPDLETYATGARISHSISRSGAFEVGYQYRTGEFGLDGLTKEHRATIGGAYSPALSGSRRLTIRLNLGPAWMEVPEAAVANVSAGEVDRVYSLQADASVSYPFRPNWRATATYRRGMEYLAGLSEPVFSDGARAELTGLIARRVDVSALAGYATAASTLSRDAQKLRTYTGEVRIRYAVMRTFALYSEYLYYSYDQGGQTGLAPDLPSVFEQHSLRVGVALFIEIMAKQGGRTPRRVR